MLYSRWLQQPAEAEALAIGPALEPSAEGVSERRFQRVSAPTLASYEPELWSLDGKPHQRSVSAGALEEPVPAIGLGRPG